jgi:hypothetical protein
MDDIMENVKLIQELILISIKKKELMKNILDITKRQQKFIELNKIETVIKQINLKDTYIKEIDELDLNFYAKFDKLKSNLKIDSIDKINVEMYPQVKNLKKIVGEIMELTKEIKVIDDQNISKLSKDKNDLGQRLKGVRQGKKVTGAYGAYKKQVKSMFFDKKK